MSKEAVLKSELFLGNVGQVRRFINTEVPVP